MPELPEVETVRRGLAETVLGKTVASVEVTGKRSVRRQEPAEFAGELEGRRLVSAGRRGKYLLVGLEDPGVLVVHLRMSGQLLYSADPKAPRAAHTHVVVSFTDGTELRFVDPRTFGELFVAKSVDAAGLPVELAGLGVDPLVDGLDAGTVHRILQGSRAPLKAVLLDQNKIAGIGSLYADEILFLARLRPDRRANGVSRPAARRLVEAADTVLAGAVAARGSSLKDARYRDLMGELGAYQLHHAVYGRAGEPCPVCATPVKAIRVGGRSAHFCPRCQR